MISAVIVTYYPCLDNLDNLVRSLASQCDFVIIVDNTPSLEEKYSSFENLYGKNFIYISLGDNLGIAKAQNIGITKALELKSEFIAVFDQDSSIDSNFISALLAVYTKLNLEKKKVAAVGPAFVDVKSNIVSPAIQYRGAKVKKINIDKEKEYTPADHIISSGSIFHVSAMDNIGFMDEQLFIDYVDLEWGMRAKRKGYSCYIANLVEMKHSIGDKSVKIPFINRYANIHSDFRKYFIMRNAFYLAFYSDLEFFWRFHQVIKNLKYIVFLLLYVNPRFKNLKIFFIALRDALLKKMYKGSM
ncbi:MULTISPECIES: glycosyltransferase family 2 protein [unclassified Acinetobacter]|uniref:glycosyltransferase family 2 protein n=1 Tax=unclassified Acinetobacter TaxID=196816 RepID=UPI0015D1A8D3|nr:MULTISPECIES: glycosyltransferase family 2 protein [unclassified Acinetobacter]